jgi:hypothetical protein
MELGPQKKLIERMVRERDRVLHLDKYRKVMANNTAQLWDKRMANITNRRQDLLNIRCQDLTTEEEELNRYMI